jgi:histidinol phosphatase-like enzyme
VIAPGRIDALRRFVAQGFQLAAHAWRPQVTRDETDPAQIEACFARVRELLGVEIDLACCPHDAGPPVCWCRKPLPGLVLALAHRRGLALDQCLAVGRSPADRTLAQRLGMTYHDHLEFFGEPRA